MNVSIFICCDKIAISDVFSVQLHFVIIDGFYTALFSALEQTHCALVACDSE